MLSKIINFSKCCNYSDFYLTLPHSQSLEILWRLDYFKSPHLTGSDLLMQNLETFLWTSNHFSTPPNPQELDLLMQNFCVDFRFVYIKSLLPPQEFDLLMENLDILCGFQIWLHEITPASFRIRPSHADIKHFVCTSNNPYPPNQTYIENLDILCEVQIWLHQITPSSTISWRT